MFALVKQKRLKTKLKENKNIRKSNDFQQETATVPCIFQQNHILFLSKKKKNLSISTFLEKRYRMAQQVYPVLFDEMDPSPCFSSYKTAPLFLI